VVVDLDGSDDTDGTVAVSSAYVGPKEVDRMEVCVEIRTERTGTLSTVLEAEVEEPEEGSEF